MSSDEFVQFYFNENNFIKNTLKSTFLQYTKFTEHDSLCAQNFTKNLVYYSVIITPCRKSIHWC